MVPRDRESDNQKRMDGGCYLTIFTILAYLLSVLGGWDINLRPSLGLNWGTMWHLKGLRFKALLFVFSGWIVLISAPWIILKSSCLFHWCLPGLRMCYWCPCNVVSACVRINEWIRGRIWAQHLPWWLNWHHIMPKWILSDFWAWKVLHWCKKMLEMSTTF